jgi:hypothetical protein
MRKNASTRRERIANPMDAGRISQAGKVAQAVRDNG